MIGPQDRGNVLDLVLDLDRPVVLPPPPAKPPTAMDLLTKVAGGGGHRGTGAAAAGAVGAGGAAYRLWDCRAVGGGNKSTRRGQRPLP